jgi:hypothetical protein
MMQLFSSSSQKEEVNPGVAQGTAKHPSHFLCHANTSRKLPKPKLDDGMHAAECVALAAPNSVSMSVS